MGDHSPVRDGLRARLKVVPGFLVVSEASNDSEAHAQLAALQHALVQKNVGMKHVKRPVPRRQQRHRDEDAKASSNIVTTLLWIGAIACCGLGGISAIGLWLAAASKLNAD